MARSWPQPDPTMAHCPLTNLPDEFNNPWLACLERTCCPCFSCGLVVSHASLHEPVPFELGPIPRCQCPLVLAVTSPHVCPVPMNSLKKRHRSFQQKPSSACPFQQLTPSLQTTHSSPRVAPRPCRRLPRTRSGPPLGARSLGLGAKCSR